MYRSTPHSKTLRLPSELMFGRNIRDNIPRIEQPLKVNEELRSQKKKAECKPYDVAIGDRVYILTNKNKKVNKLTPNFDSRSFRVVDRKGSEVVVEDLEPQVQYRRNVAHVIKATDDVLAED